MGRVMADCRRWESEKNCSLTIIGDEDEVVRAASAHAVADHGHADTAELRDEVRGMLEPAEAYSTERSAEPFPAG